MVHLRSTRIVIVLLLSLIALECFIVLTQRDIAVYQYKDLTHKSDEELDVKTTMNGANSSRKWLRGRKMMVEEMKEVRGTVNTGANHSVRKHGHGEDGNSRLGCELRHRIRPSRVHFAGLIPFSSDYHAPKNHPPKNN